MRVKCLYNKGNKFHEAMSIKLQPGQFSKFGFSDDTELNLLEIGNEYFVMGLILNREKECLEYLIDAYGSIGCYPNQLFEVTESKIPSNWYFRQVNGRINSHIFYWDVDAIFGYYELCFDDHHYGKLLDVDEKTHIIYFKRKEEAKLALENLL